jgi:hypothetical protein
MHLQGAAMRNQPAYATCVMEITDGYTATCVARRDGFNQYLRREPYPDARSGLSDQRLAIVQCNQSGLIESRQWVPLAVCGQPPIRADLVSARLLHARSRDYVAVVCRASQQVVSLEAILTTIPSDAVVHHKKKRYKQTHAALEAYRSMKAET